jgi:hypothetical protein
MERADGIPEWEETARGGSGYHQRVMSSSSSALDVVMEAGLTFPRVEAARRYDGRRRWKAVVCALVLAAVAAPVAQAPGVQLTPEEMEAFMTKARVVSERVSSKGVTGAVRATLTDGVITHDVQFQTVDERIPFFRGGAATEIDFRDTYRFNIAGYRLAQLVGIQTVPMSAERNYKGQPSAVTWWIDDVMFDEGERVKQKDRRNALGPDPDRTQKQILLMYVWDELIQNRDRNTGNIQWTKDWTMWLIDHTRAFRRDNKLLRPERLTRCERGLLEKLKALTEESITAAMMGILTRDEIRPILRRRDAIVQHFEKLIEERGEATVLYSL